jgi:hypothetical protein
LNSTPNTRMNEWRIPHTILSKFYGVIIIFN